jgi:GTPase SAR1 family protein
MEGSVAEIARDARKRTGELKERVDTLASTVREAGDLPEVLETLSLELAHAVARSIAELDRPQFPVAFVGTTKAGKSTFVNAFIGRRLAPMEAEEMSAGLLRISEGDWSVAVERGAPISCVANERAIYDALKASMSAVVASRRTRAENEVVAQPIYAVTGPLFPSLPQHEFQKESAKGAIGLTVFDLPGLRTTKDPENQAVIREQIKRAFSIVLIDRNSLFNIETQVKLLEELRELVADLGGDISMMVFLLNKVDGHKHEDGPIHEQVRRAQVQIRECLHLQEKDQVQVVPFSGLTYYHASRMVVAATEGRWTEVQAMREGFLKDCANHVEYFLKQAGYDYKEFRQAKRQMEDDLSAEPVLQTDQQQLILLISSALKASGHEELWKVLNGRMRDHGRKVLLLPPLYSTIKLARDYSRQLRGYAQTQVVETEAELLSATERLNEIQTRAAAMLAGKRAEIEKGQERLLELDRRGTGGEEERDKILHMLGARESESPSLWQLRALVSKIRAEVGSKVLEKIGEFLKAGSSSLDVRDYFNGLAAGSAFADEVGRAFEALKEVGYNTHIAVHGFSDDHHKPTKEQKDHAEKVHKCLARLFLALRRVMTAHAEQYLRLLGGQLAAEVNDLSRRQAVSVWRDVTAELVTELERSSDRQTGALLHEFLAAFEFSPVDFGESQVLALPPEVLQIPEPTFTQTTTHDFKYSRYEDPDACFFKGNLITEVEKREVLEFRLPSADQIETVLLSGIDGAQDALWGRYFKWFEACSRRALEVVQVDFERYLDLVRQGLARRRSEMHQDAAARKNFWSRVESQLRDVDERVKELERDANLSTGN